MAWFADFRAGIAKLTGDLTGGNVFSAGDFNESYSTRQAESAALSSGGGYGGQFFRFLGMLRGHRWGDKYEAPRGLHELQSVCGELGRTSPYIAGALDEIVRGVVGDKILPVRLEGVTDIETTRRVTMAWRDYWEGKEVDMSGRSGFDLEAATLRDVLTFGDAAVDFTTDGRTEHFSGRQITAAANALGYRHPTNNRHWQTNFQGVLVDEYGKLMELWVRRMDELGGGAGKVLTMTEPGNALYIALPQRGLQTIRPWPAITPILIAAVTLQEWDKGLALSLDLKNKIPAILKSRENETSQLLRASQAVDSGGMNFGDDDADGTGESWNPADAVRPISELVDGRNVLTMPYGYDIEIPDTSAGMPGVAFNGYRDAVLGMLAAGLGQSRATMQKHAGLSNSYSAARMDKLSDEALYRSLRNWWWREYRTPIFRRWLVRNAPTLNIKMAVAQTARPLWLSPPMEHIDPQKQIAALTMQIRARLISPLEAIMMLTGRLPEDIAEEGARFEDLFGVDIMEITNANAGAESPAGDGGNDDGGAKGAGDD